MEAYIQNIGPSQKALELGAPELPLLSAVTGLKLEGVVSGKRIKMEGKLWRFHQFHGPVGGVRLYSSTLKFQREALI